MSVQVSESGIAFDHISKIELVAKNLKCFILIRPVNTLATGLIEENYPVKGLDIHGKSSDWGPQAGFVPWDQALSKSAGNPSKIRDGTKSNKKDIRNSNIIRVPLKLTKNRITQLQTRLQEEEFYPFIPINAENGAEFTLERDSKFRFSLTSSDNGQAYEVSYRKSTVEDTQSLDVMGYSEGKLKMVTADYDLFAVCPFHETIHDSTQVTTLTDGGLLGILSNYHRRVIEQINNACRPALPVVRHGAELSNPHPQEDEKIVMFTVSGGSRMINNDLVTRAKVFSDLIRRGFHIYVNPKWKPEVQTAITSRMKRSFGSVYQGALESLQNSDFTGCRCRFDMNFVNLYVKKKRVLKAKTIEFPG